MRTKLAFIYVAFGLVIGFLVGLVTGHFSLHAVGEIKEWQTLIAGVIAVSAAVATMIVMTDHDRRQEERHREDIKLARRSEWLALHQAAEPAGKLVHGTGAALCFAAEQLRMTIPERPRVLDMSGYKTTIEFYLDTASLQCKDRSITRAEPYFTPAAYDTYRDLNALIDSFRNQLGVFDPLRENLDTHQRDFWVRMCGGLNVIGKLMQRFSAELDEMAAEAGGN